MLLNEAVGNGYANHHFSYPLNGFCICVCICVYFCFTYELNYFPRVALQWRNSFSGHPYRVLLSLLFVSVDYDHYGVNCKCYTGEHRNTFKQAPAC